MGMETVIKPLSVESVDVNLDELAIKTPTPLIIILGLYLLFVFKIGPYFMKSREPFQLKSYIVIYNIYQVVSCVYLVHKVLVSDFPIFRFWECEILKSGSPEMKEFNEITRFTFWLKISELSETVVFVLRKKQRQVSGLHVFHHCSTLFLAYHLSRTYKGNSSFYPIFLNCNVHIVMYCYYLMAAILPESIVAKLTPIKKSITTIQMIQFGLILLQVIVGLSKGCEVPVVMLCLYVAIIVAFSFMFYEFYKKNYYSRESSTLKISKSS